MTENLKTCYRSELIDGKRYYRGMIKVTCSKDFHYFVKSDCPGRLTKNDALTDAENLAAELAGNSDY